MAAFGDRSRFRFLAFFLLVPLFSSKLAFSETIELVTYYPASANSGDLHVRSITVGNEYDDVGLDDGEAIIRTDLGIGPGFDTVAPSGPLHVVSSGAADDANDILLDYSGNTPAAGPELVLRRSRGTVAAPAGVQLGDKLGGVKAFGLGSGALREGASVGFEVDTAPSGTSVPTAIQFLTAGLERMRVTSTGNVGIGTNAPTQALDVNGTVQAPSVILIPQAVPPAAPQEGMIYQNDVDDALFLFAGGIWRKLVSFQQILLGEKTLASDYTIVLGEANSLVGAGRADALNINNITPQRGLYAINWSGEVEIDANAGKKVAVQIAYYLNGNLIRIDKTEYFDDDFEGKDNQFTTHDITGSSLVNLAANTNYDIRIRAWRVNGTNGTNVARAKSGMKIRADLVLAF